MEEETQKAEEVEGTHEQIEWFERTRVDQNKRPRYANLNLQEIKGYEQAFNTRLANKRAELDKQK